MVYCWYIDYFTQFNTRRNTLSMFVVMYASLLDCLCVNYLLWDTGRIRLIFRGMIDLRPAVDLIYIQWPYFKGQGHHRGQNNRKLNFQKVFLKKKILRNEVNLMNYIKHEYWSFLKICTYGTFFLIWFFFSF